ncbi:MAG: hypothetical protein JOZ81_27490, partial [Chloroflexi bacterium]|nr:hypothetical protein [Chloroflexota bacterium]
MTEKPFDLATYWEHIPWAAPRPLPPPADPFAAEMRELKRTGVIKGMTYQEIDEFALLLRFKEDVCAAIARRLAEDRDVEPTEEQIAQDLISTSAVSARIHLAKFKELRSAAFPRQTWDHVVAQVRAGQVLPKAAQYGLAPDQVDVSPQEGTRANPLAEAATQPPVVEVAPAAERDAPP